MSVVWKYTINLEEKPTVLKLPRYAQPLFVGVQGTEIRMWVLVDEKYANNLRERAFVVIPTGYANVPDDATYYGTVQIDWTVWHVFEVFS